MYDRSRTRIGVVTLVAVGLTLTGCPLGNTGSGTGPTLIDGPPTQPTPGEIAATLSSDTDFAQRVADLLEGRMGAPATSCWDLDGNGLADEDEDSNGDELYNALDCRGDDGSRGTPGRDGLHCWDTNGNNQADDEEDTNEDGKYNAADCQGVVGDIAHSSLSGLDNDDHPEYVREGEANSVTNEMIAQGAIDLGKLNPVNAQAGDVVSYNGSNVRWTRPASLPSLAFAERDDGPVLNSSWQVCEQVLIEAPGSGTVLVTGNASIAVGPDLGHLVNIGISDSPSDSPRNLASRVSFYHEDVGADIPVTTQHAKSVSAGLHRFYLVARRIGSSGTISVESPQLSVLFIPD